MNAAARPEGRTPDRLGGSIEDKRTSLSIVGPDVHQLAVDRAWHAGYDAAVAELTRREYRVIHHRVGWGAQNASRLFQRKSAALAFFAKLLAPDGRWGRADLVRLESRRVGEWQLDDEVDDRW